jgi:hypothetical protein
VTITNNGGANLVISATAVAGANANQFARTTTCATVTPGNSCTINVTFRPTTAGAKTATLTITHNAAGSPSSVALTGTGGAAGPIASVNATLAFPQTRAGTTNTNTLTVTNTGSGTLSISAATASALPFGASLGTCNVGIAAGRSCRLNVTFSPTAVGTFTGTLTITSNASNSPNSVSLSGSSRR